MKEQTMKRKWTRRLRAEYKILIINIALKCVYMWRVHSLGRLIVNSLFK